ncbi:hypothetical protein ACTGZM_11135, partial [Streptococcus suis]
RTRFLSEFGTQFFVGHVDEPIDVDVQPQAEAAIRLLGISPQTDNRGVIGLVREKLRQKEAIPRVDEICYRCLL